MRPGACLACPLACLPCRRRLCLIVTIPPAHPPLCHAAGKYGVYGQGAGSYGVYGQGAGSYGVYGSTRRLSAFTRDLLGGE